MKVDPKALERLVAERPVTVPRILPVRSAEHRWVQLTRPQLEAVERAVHQGLYGYGPDGNRNALRHALRKLQEANR